jgi:hypothetical protein
LGLIRADNLKLRAATEVQLRLGVGLGLGVGAAGLQRYEETVFELQTKVDELETVVASLTE